MPSNPFLINKNGRPYKLARYVESARRPYVEFYAYSQTVGKAVRKRFYNIEGDTPEERRKSGAKMVASFNRALRDGYVLGVVTEVEKTGVVIPHILKALELAVSIKVAENGTRSQQTYTSFMNVFREWYKTQKIDPLVTSFRRRDVMSFLDWLKTSRSYRGKVGVSNRTRNNYLVLIHALFEVLKSREIIEHNPADKIPKLAVKSSMYVAFTESQQAILGDYLRNNDYQMFLFTRFVYYCFLRPVEISRLKIKHLELDRRIMTVRAGDSKNQKQQVVAIPRSLLGLIEKMNLQNYPDDYYIFSRDDYKPGSDQLVRNRISERHSDTLKALNMWDGELSLYSWKHTGNVRAYEAGVDILTIQEQNRHHNLAMTEVYLRSLGLRVKKELLDKDW